MFTGLRPYRICGGDTITNGYTYKNAGVDIDAGNRLVERIKPLAAATRRAGADGDLGGFGGLFDPRAAGYEDPVLVAATDGVGTKLKLAIDADKHDTVGIDLVAMCANDLIVQGAEPLFFLDYFATGKLSEETAEAVIAGVASGCREAGCALIGGETAEMPGMYADGDYDLAGFCVGAAERGTLLDGGTIAAGDVVLGLASSGVHSNGYSLVRKLVSDGGFDLDKAAPFDTAQPLGAALLTPTRLYIRSCLAAIRAGGVKGLAHITGGGILENLPRIFPDRVGVEIDFAAWPVPPVFRWLAGIGGIEPTEMARTFNCGIGMAVVVSPDAAEAIENGLRADGEAVYRIGRIVPGDGNVVLQGMDRAWAG